jgi:hypothetical protein
MPGNSVHRKPSQPGAGNELAKSVEGQHYRPITRCASVQELSRRRSDHWQYPFHEPERGPPQLLDRQPDVNKRSLAAAIEPGLRLIASIRSRYLDQVQGGFVGTKATSSPHESAACGQISCWAEGIFVTLFGLDLGVPCRNPGDNGDRLRRPVTWPPPRTSPAPLFVSLATCATLVSYLSIFTSRATSTRRSVATLTAIASRSASTWPVLRLSRTATPRCSSRMIKPREPKAGGRQRRRAGIRAARAGQRPHAPSIAGASDRVGGSRLIERNIDRVIIGPVEARLTPSEANEPPEVHRDGLDA